MLLNTAKVFINKIIKHNKLSHGNKKQKKKKNMH